MKNSPLSEYAIYLFNQGDNYRSYQMLGSHLVNFQGENGVSFAVWAPHAKSVSVVGDFNNWDGTVHVMSKCGSSGIWQIFISGMTEHTVYKYQITTAYGKIILKADPYAFYAELRPNTASKVYSLENYAWNDAAWVEQRKHYNSYQAPMLTYEVHLGSWRRGANGEFLSYKEMAEQLVSYVKEMNYTHIEIMPICEHPFDGSWGYQATGYFAVTSRYGEPKDFMYLVDLCHQNNIGVILDWVPGHFCRDDHGLRKFDGQPLYESPDPMLAENDEWGTTNFDYSRYEVKSFLISNAMFWLDVYHIDGLRIDAVANMLYLDYGKEEGQWKPNKHGGNGNLAAMDFLRHLNHVVFENHPNALMIAEESTSWPLMTKPVYIGGMGFNYKWNMGWMNDILKYMEFDAIYRKWNHNLITFSLMYAFSENYVLPLSHDEVVHGKKSLVEKMPGDYWQKFANLRAFYGYWMAHPGKKLLFMGSEFAQFIEWKYYDSLDWHLLEYPLHKKMHDFVKNLNAFYVEQKSLWEIDCDWKGFEWIDCHDYSKSVISFIRKTKKMQDFVIVVCNFTPEVHYGYRIGVPQSGKYLEVLNSDATEFGGSGVSNIQELNTEPISWHNQENSLVLTLPPLSTIYLKITRE